ncbi:MAG: alanyl-tRNA editing protein [Acidobacteria bacterium]|nr:alanyl-tRNA editing protein [Acidobacteriota bacterium]
MTTRLYFSDSYLTQFDAAVQAREDGGTRIVLDRTAFYPASGGQPCDSGSLNGIGVIDVIDEADTIVHVLERPLDPCDRVQGRIDWPRRFDHMQQHSGQHLLSAVFDSLYGYKTLSFHMGADSSTIDLDTPSLEPARLREAEARANELVSLNSPVSVSFEDAATVRDLRKESGREGTLRIVTIDGFDRSACGGTHVRATGEIGAVLLRRVEKIRGGSRVEFVCGLRAAMRARADFDALSHAARLFSAQLEEVPALIAAQIEQAKESEKARRRLALELASARGRDLYTAAAPDAARMRRHLERLDAALGDELRATAQSYCAQPLAVFIAASANPPSVLMASSADSGLDAGSLLKEALAAAGGKGGGNARLAQGSLPSPEALESLLAHLTAQ